ncbi:glycosyltransferase family 4 protein [Modestobacter italicus]|uniref:glycosyltransferase family 4 protein n=1 Tax=Modestobacter italicus (strain DSM 44449 / CECT 9708 / BC 501) TaxID=2732864 RepID=UPI001C953EB5|nr:glycosyltransferase family 4 protein [Modestobacter italicus]
MKILTNALSLERLGGVEVNALEVTRALVSRGHEVHLVFGPPLSDGVLPDMRPEFEAAGVTLHGPQAFLPPTVATAVPAALRSLPTASLAARLRPDVLWLQRFEHAIWGQVVARRSGTPIVCHLHHALNASRLVPVAASGVRRFIAVSAFMREHWAAAGLAPERIDVVHNAVPEGGYPVGGQAERAMARTELGLPPDVPIALFYGRLDESKGLRMALDAWDRATPRLRGAHLLLAGDFTPGGDPALPGRVAELVSGGAATLLPAQRDVVPLLHATDLVLFPSQLPESFGRVALEGLMTGRPVLATSVGGVPEILSGALSRLLVPQTDVDAFAAGLVDLLDWRRADPGLGTRCATQAREHFSFTDHVTRVEQVLSRHSRGAAR